MGIVKAGAQGSFGNIDELGNLGVGEPLDIAEVHDFLVGRGELGDGAGELAAQVLHLSLAHRVGLEIGIGQLGILFKRVAVFIVIQAEAALALALAQVVAGSVQRNGLEPGVERAVPLEVTKRMECFEKGFLRYIVGIGFAVKHLDEHGIELAAVASDKLIIRTGASIERVLDELLICQLGV